MPGSGAFFNVLRYRNGKRLISTGVNRRLNVNQSDILRVPWNDTFLARSASEGVRTIPRLRFGLRCARFLRAGYIEGRPDPAGDTATRMDQSSRRQ